MPRSHLIEQPPVSEDLLAEVILKGLLTDEIYLRFESIPQIGEESSELEEIAVVRCHDAEVVIAVRIAVAPRSGTEEVHLENPVLGGDGSDYVTELLERVLLHLIHRCRTAFALYKPGSSTTVTSVQYLQTRYRHPIIDTYTTTEIEIDSSERWRRNDPHVRIEQHHHVVSFVLDVAAIDLHPFSDPES